MGPLNNPAVALANLRTECDRLSERIESQTRYAEVIETKLREMMERAGHASVTVEIFDPIRPLNGGVSLTAVPERDREVAFGARGRAAASPQAATDSSWWPRRAEKTDRPPLKPNAGWWNYTLHGRVDKVVGVSVCGLPRQALEAIVATIVEQQTALRDFVPVFLTDSTDFDVFRRHGFVFEYLPSAAKQATYAGTKNWTDYAAERRALLERKWGLAHVICFGPSEFGRPPADIPALDRLSGVSRHSLESPDTAELMN